MEFEADKCDDGEKQLIKRRLSILKLPKLRNPLEDQPVRRVSFASSSFIKPFATDPEKNTIWDTTYEEDVNYTNSTQSSCDQTVNSWIRSTSTLVEATAHCHEIDMSLTRINSILGEENVPINITKQNLSFAECIKTASRNEIKPIFDLNNSKLFDVFDDDLEVSIDFTIRKETDMNLSEAEDMANDFSGQNSKQLNEKNKNVIDLNLNKQNQPKEKDFQETDMELTCQNSQREINDTNVTESDTEMEFTCQSPQDLNFTNAKEVSMDLTCQIPQNHLATICGDVNETEIYTSDMEMACQISHVVQNLQKNTSDMEFTCQLPSSSKVNEDSTYHLPTEINHSNIFGKTDLNYPSLATIDFINQTFSEDISSKPNNSKRQESQKHSLKHDLSRLPTPEPSFHVNLANFSSGTYYDTQELLECNFSKDTPGPSMVSKFEDNTSLKHNIKGITTPDFDVPRTKLLNLNETYVLNDQKKIEMKNTNLKETDENDDSLGLIPDDCIQEIDFVEGNPSPEEMLQVDETKTKFENCAKKLVFKKYELPPKDSTEITKLLQNVKDLRQDIVNRLRNFEVKPIAIPKDFSLSKKLSDTAENLNETNESEEVVCLSIEEKIRKHQDRCKKCWELVTTESDCYHFSTLFGAILFTVKLDVEFGKVLSLKFESKLSDDSKPLARFILKMFLNNLQEDRIRSALGASYDVFSILDYIQMVMLKSNRFQRFFLLCDMVSIEEDLTITIKIISVPLGSSCQLLIKTNDLDNLDLDEDVIYIVVKYGKLRAVDIKDLVKSCPKGIDFFKYFVDFIRDFVKAKEEKN